MTDVVANPEKMMCSSIMPWWVILLWGILSVVIGIMFLTTPGITTILFITLLGAFWLVGGLFSIASLVVDKSNWGLKLFLAIINILAGVVILLYPLFSTLFLLAFFVIFIGFWGCFIGISHLYHAFKTKDAGNGVLGLISLIFGILLLVYPFIAAALLPLIAGAFMIVMGLAAVVAGFMAKKVSAILSA
ncbi:MAG: DUF308 domain-containing protein [Methanoregula sp.]|jgi:uncharacterized membrane protein HdeD (DUF308 family)